MFGNLRDSQVTARFRAMHDLTLGQLRSPWLQLLRRWGGLRQSMQARGDCLQHIFIKVRKLNPTYRVIVATPTLPMIWKLWPYFKRLISMGGVILNGALSFLSILTTTTSTVGAAAAAPEEGELACPWASPHLPVVGARNPVAVLGLAR
jgi:hypothetical protein